MSLETLPIGIVRSTRTTPEDDRWDAEQSFIELDATRFAPDALAGLDAFSHVEIVYVFDRVDPQKVETRARHPRNNPAWPRVGIFAQRAKNRPNRIGTTICRIDRVEGLRLHVTGLDAIEGTPVLDLEPWGARVRPARRSAPAAVDQRADGRLLVSHMQVALAKVAIRELAQKESDWPFWPGKVQHWP